MAKTRTFIGVAVEGEVRGAALATIEKLTPYGPGVKWVEPDKLHWTLQFLGDIDDVEMAEACRRVVRVAAEHEPFVMQARGVSAFPSIQKPRTLYLAAGEGSEAFCQLQADIEAGLEEFGFRGEARQFVPHLTLGRIGRGNRGNEQLVEQLQAMSELACGAMPVDEATVFASRLHRAGPEYHVLATASLGESH